MSKTYRIGILAATAMCVGLAAVGPAAVAASAGVGGGPGVSAAVEGSERGGLVSAQRLRAFSAGQARAWLASDDFDASMVRYGVDTYRLVYRTVDPHGRATTASGLLVLPRNHARRLATVSFTHGTELYRPDAPSTSTDVWGAAPAVMYGAAGFAAVAPDYLGLGVGPGLHPWMDVPSETTASLDMLRAGRAFVARTGRELRSDVFVTGFSQGASAAMGLARALQDGADKNFRLRAVAPISGAYAFRDAELPALLADGDDDPASGEIDPRAGVVYTAYLLVAFNRLHHIYKTPDQVFQQPYAQIVEKLFDGNTPGQDVVMQLPGSLDDLLMPAGRAMLENPTGRFAAALRIADSTCTNWTPRVPIRLYMASQDEQAVNANTYRCHGALAARGVTAPIIDVGPVGHINSNRQATAAILRWFSRL